MQRRVHGFVDEYGDTSIRVEKSGVSGHFIMSAVLVKDQDLEEAIATVSRVQKAFFPGGEMKSSRLGHRKDGRRLKLVRALADAPFTVYAFAVDKREIHPESGLAWRKSFFKYLNRLLYERLFRTFEDVEIVADEHGSRDFMQSFEAYIQGSFKQSLFSRWNFRFSDGAADVLLQLPDIVSGTLARCIDPDKRSDLAEDFLEVLSRRSIDVVMWPPRRRPPPRAFVEESGPDFHDELIRRHCLRLAHQYLEQNEVSREEAEQARVTILQRLLFHAEFVSDRAYLPSGRLTEHLREVGGIAYSQQQLRHDVIAPLRDIGVIIASSPKGYKIPVSAVDMANFVAHANVIVPAMLRRLSGARDELRTASMGELDILNGDYLTKLRELVDLQKKSG